MGMITHREIYLDCNATHPLLTEVRKGMADALLNEDAALANPASIHRRGQKARKSVADLRDCLCQYLGRPDGDEFVFLSGATEAINLGIRGFCDDRISQGREVTLITDTVEHSAIIDTFNDLKGRAHTEQHILPVDKYGQFNHEDMLKVISEAVAADRDVLLCLQVTNNETGVSFDLNALLPRIHAEHGPKPQSHLPKIKGGKYPETPQRVWVLLDGAQGLGKLPEAHMRMAVHHSDYLALCAHKFGGPAGIGTLWLRPSAPFKQQMTGGTQERKRRAGTLNSVGLLGFRLALQEWMKCGEKYRAHMNSLRTHIVTELKKLNGMTVHGETADGQLPALCNTLNFHIEGCPEESLLLALDLDGVCVSSGSACNSGSLKPSRVLTAMGFAHDHSLASIRVCVGVETTQEEVDAFIESVRKKVEHIRLARKRSAEMLS
jgi:cysteine desulfurase